MTTGVVSPAIGIDAARCSGCGACTPPTTRSAVATTACWPPAMLAAPGLGLGTCMIGFALPAPRALAGVPEGHAVHAVLVAVHPAVRFHHSTPREPVPATWAGGRE